MVSRSEVIHVDNKSYIRLDKADLGPMKLADDGWTLSPVSPQQSAKMMQDSLVIQPQTSKTIDARRWGTRRSIYDSDVSLRTSRSERICDTSVLKEANLRTS